MLPAVLVMCMDGGIEDASRLFLTACETFGVSLNSEVVSWLEKNALDEPSKIALKELVADDRAGKLIYGIKATTPSIPNFTFLIKENNRMMARLVGDSEAI